MSVHARLDGGWQGFVDLAALGPLGSAAPELSPAPPAVSASERTMQRLQRPAYD